MNLMWQIVWINFYSLIIPFVVIMEYYFNFTGLKIRDHNEIMAILICGPIIISPYIVFACCFYKYRKKYSPVAIVRRMGTAYVVWSIGLWIEPAFYNGFSEGVKIPFIPFIAWNNPTYQIVLSGMELLYCIFVLSVAVILGYLACRSIPEVK